MLKTVMCLTIESGDDIVVDCDPTQNAAGRGGFIISVPLVQSEQDVFEIQFEDEADALSLAQKIAHRLGYEVRGKSA